MSAEAHPLVYRATVRDVAGIARIARASFHAPWDERVFLEELGRDFAELLVRRTTPTSEPVAFVSFWIVRDELHVLSLATAASHRRAGHGRILLAAALDRARARGALRASLEVRTDNLAARALYEELGFHVIATRRGYYAEDAADAVVMLRGLGEREALRQPLAMCRSSSAIPRARA